MDNDTEIHDLLYRLRESQIRTVYAIRRLLWVAIATVIDVVLIMALFLFGDMSHDPAQYKFFWILVFNFLFLLWLIGVYPKRLSAIFRGDLPPKGW